MNPAKAIWNKRANAHLKIVARYSSYAGRSGFFLFLLIAVIAGSYGYGKLLSALPESFPYRAALAAWLALFAAVSPIRTLLRKADLIFLVPMESRMGPYFRAAFLYSFAGQSFLTLCAVTIAMPMYRHGLGAGAEPFAAVLLFALAMKIANLLGSWAESGIVRPGGQAAYRAARWIGSAALFYLYFSLGFIAAAASFFAVLAAMALWARSSRKVTVNWMYLLEKEEAHQTNMLLFFNWFIDTDLPHRVKPRRLWTRFAQRIPARRENTYLFLYWMTLIRSDMFGMIARMTLLSFIILMFTERPLVYAAVYLIFHAATAVQLASLERYHRHSVWPALYPLPESLRRASAASVAFAVQLAQAAVLALPAFRPDVFTPWLLALPLAGAASAVFFRFRAFRESRD
jgi:ABC-2 type transport system permease protein